ncbi:S-methyl-5-thioribose-1-phosphate isomerase [soil metagenome]
MPPVKTIEWTGSAARIIDQTLLPGVVEYVDIGDDQAMWQAIRVLRVRGAPAIGVAAAYGYYLGVKLRVPRTVAELRKSAGDVSAYLATSRPTAVNLFWALKKCDDVVAAFAEDMPIDAALDALLDEAKRIHADDERTCDLIGKHGAPLLSKITGVLTHCNAGALATAGSGTALSVIYEAAKSGDFVVYSDETRPLLQGARLTAWELLQAGIDTRLITDSTAGTVLQKGLVQAVVVGADRIAANGDTANKIGTMPLAIAATYYNVPFYVAAPLSTFDRNIETGAEIPIEERASEEITIIGGTRLAPRGVKTFSPAFDVTPAELIAGIITEKGVLRPPYRESIAAAFD